MSWHVEPELLRRYQVGEIDGRSASSIEMHVTVCAECRSLIKVEGDWLRRSWTGIQERVEPGQSGIGERLLVRLGVSESSARIVAVSPAFRPSFVLAVLLALGSALALDRLSGGGSGFFLFVAPLLPVAGVAVSYGRFTDPLHDMTLSAPLSSFNVLLMRTISVVSLASLSSLVAWVAVPNSASIGVMTWLLPAVALTSVTLALASRIDVGWAALISAFGWVSGLLIAGEAFSALGSGRQLLFIGLIFVGGATVWASRDLYQRRVH